MIKRIAGGIIIVVLISAFAIFLGAPAQSAKAEEYAAYMRHASVALMNQEYHTDVEEEKVKTLHDFAGNSYTLIECVPTGYMILRQDNGAQVEYSASSVSPYRGYGSDLYYGGFGQFYQLQGTDYVHTLTGERAAVTEEVIERNVALYKSLQDEAPQYGVSTYTENYDFGGRTYTCVGCYQYFVNLKTSTELKTKPTGYCAYNAATILLGWYDTFVNDAFVDNAWMSPRSNSYYRYFINSNLVDKLIAYGSGESSINSTKLRKVMNQYFEEYSVPAGSYDMITPFFTAAALKRALDVNTPVILMGSLESPNGGKTDHAVLVYGYTTNTSSGKNYGFLAHYGLPGYSQVTINGSGTSTFSTMYRITI